MMMMIYITRNIRAACHATWCSHYPRSSCRCGPELLQVLQFSVCDSKKTEPTLFKKYFHYHKSELMDNLEEQASAVISDTIQENQELKNNLQSLESSQTPQPLQLHPIIASGMGGVAMDGDVFNLMTMGFGPGMKYGIGLFYSSRCGDCRSHDAAEEGHVDAQLEPACTESERMKGSLTNAVYLTVSTVTQCSFMVALKELQHGFLSGIKISALGSGPGQSASLLQVLDDAIMVPYALQ